MVLYQLRNALNTERDQIATIWHASASLPNVGPEQMPSYAVLRTRVDDELAAGWVVTVATEGKDIVAFLAIRPEHQYLDQLFVSPLHLSKGLGRRLMDHAKAVMYDGFTLDTNAKNTRARRFYEREELIFEGEGIHPSSGHPVAHYRWNGD